MRTGGNKPVLVVFVAGGGCRFGSRRGVVAGALLIIGDSLFLGGDPTVLLQARMQPAPQVENRQSGLNDRLSQIVAVGWLVR